MKYVSRSFCWMVVASLAVGNSAQATSISSTYCSLDGAARTLTFAGGKPIRDSMPRGLGTVETFDYIVPPSQFTTGALIVKVSHYGVPQMPPTQDDIQIQAARPKYVPRCGGQLSDGEIQRKQLHGFYAEYDRSIEKQRYINYHFYKDIDKPPAGDGADAALSRFHAEIGTRRVGLFIFWSRNACVTTDDDATVGQFLFDDTLSIASATEHLGRYSGTPIFSPARAHAAAPEYANAYGQTAAVIPYQKPAGRPACVEISVQTPAARIRVSKTTISVVDADDVALNPDLTAPRDSERTIAWQAAN